MYTIDDIHSCDKCEEFKRKLVANIIGLIKQNLRTNHDYKEEGEYNSRFCSLNANAMRLMIDLGLTKKHAIAGRFVNFNFNENTINEYGLDFPDYESELI